MTADSSVARLWKCRPKFETDLLGAFTLKRVLFAPPSGRCWNSQRRSHNAIQFAHCPPVNDPSLVQNGVEEGWVQSDRNAAPGRPTFEKAYSIRIHLVKLFLVALVVASAL